MNNIDDVFKSVTEATLFVFKRSKGVMAPAVLIVLLDEGEYSIVPLPGSERYFNERNKDAWIRQAAKVAALVFLPAQLAAVIAISDAKFSERKIPAGRDPQEYAMNIKKEPGYVAPADDPTSSEVLMIVMCEKEKNRIKVFPYLREEDGYKITYTDPSHFEGMDEVGGLMMDLFPKDQPEGL